MIKTHYLQELNIKSSYIKKGDKGADVKRVQEWIMLWNLMNNEFEAPIAIDSDFGPGTLRAIKKFQDFKDLQPDGIIGNKTWRALTQNMKEAFSIIDKSSLSSLIIAYSEVHINAEAREIIQNKGPWVRAYTNGFDGSDYAWCMGFVMTILDQAYSTLGDDLINHIPYTLSCDGIGKFALEKKKLIRNKAIKTPEKQIKPGDIFLRCSKTNDRDWTHTGFVTKVKGNIIHTIEGNTNDEGIRDGFEVCRRERNLKKENLDIFNLIA